MLCILLCSAAAWAQAIPIAKLETQKLNATVATYQGKQATRLIDGDGNGGIAVLKARTGASRSSSPENPPRVLSPQPAASLAWPFAF
jgi:hypothetical protein